MSIGNGKGRRGRLPNQLDELLAAWLVRQWQIIRAAEQVYERVDSDTARAIKALIETIIDNADSTQSDLKLETGQLRELIKELRDLRDEKKANNGNH